MTPERWYKLLPLEQLRAIAAEVKRAEIWEKKDRELYASALERALELTDFTLDDPRWKGQTLMPLVIREELSKFYIGAQKNIARLYAAL